MSTKKKRNKAYKPKNCYANVIKTVFGGMVGSHHEHTIEVMAKTYAAVAGIAEGRGGKDEFDRIVGALNMANVMCEQGYAPEYRAELLAARDAMMTLGVRAMKSGVFAFEGEEQKQVADALATHDAQLENARSIDIDRAFDEVQRRIKNRINTKSVMREVSAGA